MKISDLLGAIATLFSGTVLAQVASFFLIPILTRIYPADSLGVSETFVAYLLVLAVGVNGGYEFAVMLAKTDAESENVVKTGAFISTVICAVLALFLFGMFLYDHLTGKWQIPIYLYFCLLLGLWIEGYTQMLRVYLNRMELYGVLSSGKVANVLTRNLLSIAIGLWFARTEILVASFVAGQCANLLIYQKAAHKKGFELLNFDWQSIRLSLKTYQDFLRYSTVGAWLNMASKRLPYFILPLYFAHSALFLGYFSQMEKVLSIPLLLSFAIGDVFYKEILKTPAQTLNISLRFLVILVLTGCLPYLGLMIGGGDLFAWVLGSDYRVAGEYAQVFGVYYFLLYLVSPLSYLVDAARSLSSFFYLNLISFSVRILTWGILGKLNLPIAETLYYAAAINIALMLIQLLYFGYLAKRVPKTLPL